VSVSPSSPSEPSGKAPSLISSSPRALLSLALLVLTIGSYWPTLSNGFVNYDDDRYLLENPLVGKGLDRHNMALAFGSTAEANWHPLTWIAHMADVQLFGMRAAGHHASSLLLHGLNVILLFLLLDSATGWRWRSALVTAFFAVHPLNVECVAWVSERKSLLSTTFLLLALFAYGRYVKRPGAARYLLVAALFALGLAAKPMVITFPFLLLLVDYWPLGRLSFPEDQRGSFARAFARLALEKAPLLLLVAASAWITLYAQHQGGAVASSVGLPLAYRISNAVYSYLAYLLMGLGPVRLAVFYPHPENSLPLWKPLVAAVLLLAVSVWVWLERDRRYLLTGWLWYLGTMVPVIGVVQVGRQALADRYAYLPFLGLFVMVVWGVGERAGRLRWPAAIPASAAAIALLWFAALTWWQTGFWRDSFTLFGRALAVTKNNYLAENNLGRAYSESGQADLAFVHFQEAARLRPKFGVARYNLGVALLGRGDFAGAQREFEAAAQFAGDRLELAKTRHNLGIVLYEQNQLEPARKEITAALAIAPGKENSLLALGMIDFRLGDYPRAAEDFEKAYSVHPSPQALFWIGRSREAQGDFRGAAAAYLDALRLSPTFREAKERLDALGGKSLMLLR
jgi:tetratricopeptide (TPR) repeat protein